MSWDHGYLIVAFDGRTIQISALTIAIFIAVFLAAFVLLNRLASRSRKTCNWVRVQDEGRRPFTKWLCKSCGVEAFSTDRRPPKECKRDLDTSARA
jgi:hypothetical protein